MKTADWKRCGRGFDSPQLHPSPHGRPWARQHLTLFDVHDDDGFSKTLGGQLSSNELAMAISLHTACEVVEKALVVRRTYTMNEARPGNSFTRPAQGIRVVRRRLIVPRN